MASNPKFFFDMSIGGQPAGRIIMDLYADVVPLTEEKGAGSFAEALCEAESFHCVIPGFKGQGGFTAGNGTVGEFIDGFKFADDKNEPRSIFTEWLDGKHVGFDKVIEAMNVVKAFVDVVKALSDVVTVLERAGWRTCSIVIIIVIMIMIIKAAV